jgi:hypothetical protein
MGWFPQVEVEHLRDARRRRARLDHEGIDEEHEVPVHPHEIRILRVDDDETHHAHRHLHHLVGVRVVHERARFGHDELVGEGLADADVGLGQAAHAVHAVGEKDAVPVNGGVLGQPVGNEYANLVALDTFDRRPRRLAVVAPQVRRHARRELPAHRLGHEVELLPAVVHAPGQRPAVQRDDGVVGPSSGRRERGLRLGLRLCRRFRYRSLRRAAYQRRAEDR